MFPAVLSIGLAGLVSLLAAAATMAATYRFWRGRDHLGIAYGLGGLAALAYLSFVATWVSPVLGTVFAWAVIAGSLVVVGLTRFWVHWRAGLPVMLLTLGIAAGYVGILYLWDFPAGAFSLAAQRFTSGPLPTDNLIPFLFSERLAAAQSTHALIGDWNGSDRPPLQAGLLLLVRAAATPLGGATSGAFGASIVAQLLWVPALFALLRAFGTPKRAAFAGVLMTAVAGTTMLNTVYTWPKMMSAALVLTSAVFLLEATRRPQGFGRNFALGVVVFVFAVLAHGAAAFTIPLVVALGVVSYRRQRFRRIAAVTSAALGAGLLVYLPWMLYARFADPPGDRLLKWHLAGVLSPAAPGSFLDTIVASYRALSPGEWIAGRLANLEVAFDFNVFTGIGCFCPEDIVARRSAEFLRTMVALGFAVPALGAVIAVIAIRLLRGRSLRLEDRGFLFMVSTSVLCMVFWCLLMFLPASTVVHQGSQVWLLLLLAAPLAWISTRHPRLAVVIVVVELAFTLLFYLGMYGATRLSGGALVLSLAGILVCVVAVLLVGRPIRSGKLGTP
jgi:hypothetical protein